MRRFLVVGLSVGLFTGCFGAKKKTLVAPPAAIGPNIISLFSDTKATPRLGDLITVQVIENVSASKKTTSRSDKKTDLSADVKLDTTDDSESTKLGVKTKNKYDADNRLVKQGSLVANVTAVVEEVFPNGNVFVRGQQQITVGKGVQTVTLAGIVRPEDISNTNTVLSTRLAQAKITYKSKGEPNIHHRGILGWLFGLVF